jgi:pyruvate,water dikinase
MSSEPVDPTLGSSEPDRYWTLAQASEACPLVMTPLCWTLWVRASELGTRGSLYDFGLLPRREVRLPEDPNDLITGCFHGRMAMNVDKLRVLLGAVPGASADDFERDLLGRVRPDARPVPDSLRRVPFMAVRTPVAMLRQGPRLRALHADQLAWWRAEVLDPTGATDPRLLLAEADRRFQRSFRLHLYARANLLTAVQAQLAALAVPVGGPELVARLTGGVGGLTETGLAADLWEVARGGLSRAEFLRRHGFHGPSEGSPVARSWRETPEQLDRLLAVYRDRPDSADPRARERITTADRGRAAARLLAALPRARRPVARLLLTALAAQVRYLELGKATFVMAIDGARAAVRRIGDQMVATGVVGDRDDAFYLTLDELLGPPPSGVPGLVAYRRACRDRHAAVSLPMVWTGIPNPVRDTPTDTGTDTEVGSEAGMARAPIEVTGVGAGGGVVEGVARVVLDPDVDHLAPDEVLVCRFTDPGWAPLLGLAAAVVVDVGGVASHGAVVARELGIPCVIGTGDGTRVLRDGQRVRVDGVHGVVTVLDR